MYKHILFATDLTGDADYLIEKVRGMRGFTGARLTMIHVVEQLPGYSYAYLGIEDIEGQLIDESKAAMAKLAEQLSVSDNDLIVEIGPTKSRILEVAEKVGADLIICGSHGRHGLSLLLGSTANAVLHGAKCDVLTVRLPEDE